jgi:peptidoglycan/xylan/chitin deacetylase (PgdA/CDA1 family)
VRAGIIPVLLYHSVADDPRRGDRRYTVSLADFEAHVGAVRTSGRVPMRIGDLANGLRGHRPLPDRAVAITFDDGFSNTYGAIETLLRYELPSTVYVTSGEIGSPDRLSAAQLAELGQLSSVEVGAHSVSHRWLDELELPELTDEVRVSKARLESLTGVGVDSFAYPHGAYDLLVRESVIAAGFRSAVAVKNAVSHARDDPFAIARWTVTSDTPASRIARVLDGEGVPLAWSRERLRTRVYRAARRRRRKLRRVPRRPVQVAP